LGVQKQIEAVAKEQQTKDERQQTTPVLRAELQIPQSIKSDWERENTKKVRREWSAIGVSAATLFAVIAYALINYHMLCQMKRATGVSKDAANTAREALVDVQRAFVFPGNVRPQTFGDAINGITSLSLRFSWENSGTTPAKDATNHISYQLMANELPDDFSFPDRWPQKGKHINTTTMIAPRGGIDALVGPISINDFKAMKSLGAHMYFWGWVRYHDVFEKSEHLTEICFELTDFNGDVFSIKPVMLEPVLTSCNIHNCYDEECKGEK
jgi:hypothetical protein